MQGHKQNVGERSGSRGVSEGLGLLLPSPCCEYSGSRADNEATRFREDMRLLRGSCRLADEIMLQSGVYD